MVEGRENVKERGRKYLEALSKNGKRNGKKIGSGNGEAEEVWLLRENGESWTVEVQKVRGIVGLKGKGEELDLF